MNHTIIDNNNYERFLLLYIDNELLAHERAAVEDYVAHNATARAALQALQNSILSTESNITFQHKHLLHKKASGITLANYEEYFVLYADNELGRQQGEEVEYFVLTHPPLQTVFEQLLKSRLTPETTLFKHKDTLYKKYERKVYPMYWARLVIAASLIGIAAFLYIVIPANNTGRQSIAGNTTSSTPTAADVPAGKAATTLLQTDSNTPADNVEIQTKNNDLPNQQPKVEYAANNARATTVQKLRTPAGPVNNTTAVVVADNNSPQLSNTVAQPIIEEHLPKTITVAQQVIKPANVSLAKAPVVAQPLADALVHHVTYKVLDTNEDNENNVLLLGSAQINKNKLRGLLRKASSLFERKTERTDSEKTIKIASFEL